MLDASRDLDDVTRRETTWSLTLFLVPALTVDTDEYLAAALLGVVDVPEITAPRLERDIADDKRLTRLRQELQVRLTREVLGIGIVCLAETEEAAASA